jgi:hypothetical protein
VYDPPVAEVAPVAGSDYDLDLPNKDAEQLHLTRRIDKSLEPYTNTFISVSATLHFPPPYPIYQMKELDNLLMDAKRPWEDEIVGLKNASTQCTSKRRLWNKLPHQLALLMFQNRNKVEIETISLHK